MADLRPKSSRSEARAREAPNARVDVFRSSAYTWQNKLTAMRANPLSWSLTSGLSSLPREWQDGDISHE